MESLVAEPELKREDTTDFGLKRTISNDGNRSPSPLSTTSGSSTSTSGQTTKQRIGNVFSRLTGGTTKQTTQNSPRPTVGKFLPYVSDSIEQGVKGLTCRRVLLGHRKPIICLASSEDFLFSSSKDKSIKMWDLQNEKEFLQLTMPNHVSFMKFEKVQKLLFTVDGCKIQVWDTQICSDKPIKVLQESKNVNFIMFDEKSRLWVAFDKYVRIYITKLLKNSMDLKKNPGRSQFILIFHSPSSLEALKWVFKLGISSILDKYL